VGQSTQEMGKLPEPRSELVIYVIGQLFGSAVIFKCSGFVGCELFGIVFVFKSSITIE
jgi:hypothetical protein